MRRALLAIVCALSVASPSVADTTPEQHRSIVENTIEKFLRPEFADLKIETSALAPALAGLCLSPSGGRLVEARDVFAAVVLAWSRVEFARLGPVIVDKRLERFSFWPDPRGIGLRQVQRLLADKDATATAPDTLAGKSVAVQGLQALEFILFGTGSEALSSGDEYRCAYGSAIAQNLDGIAGDIVAGWSDEAGYVALMRNPGSDNAVYRTPAEPVGDIVKIFTFGFQFIRDVKLKAFVGEDPSKARPRRAAFWRSGLTMAAIQANFSGLQRLFEVSGLVPVIETRPLGSAFVGSVRFEFDTAIETLETDFPPIADAVVDPKEHDRLLYLTIVTNTLWRYFAEEISTSLGLTSGFNALDGD